MSAHTIRSYRDGLKLLLQCLADSTQRPVAQLTLDDIGVAAVLAFLDHLEAQRGHGVGTRNNRLAALHTFCHDLAHRYPAYLHHAQRLLRIPCKRLPTPTVDSREGDERMAVLHAVDRSHPDGRRDYALLALMFNTGVRVQELVALKASDLHFTPPWSVHLFGKGRKERICPLWAETAQVLQAYVEERGIELSKPVTVFVNHRGQPLTRFGVRYLLAKYVRKAGDSQPSLRHKRLHPHSIRHSTAVHLLKSGVDLSTIANWLGHASVNTTNKYATMDLEMKRQALAKAQPLGDEPALPAAWRHNPDLLAWLESL